MDPPRLQFVHKSSSSKSLSHSSKQETQEINRHVQLGRKHERYKRLASSRWPLPFPFHKNTSPLHSQVEATHNIPSTVSEIAGSGGDGNTTQTTYEQHLRSLQYGGLNEGQRIVSLPTMNSAPSSRSPLEPSFQLIRYDPVRTVSESTHAVRSNAVRYQWKRSKEVRPRGRKSKVPKTSDLSSQQVSVTQRNRDTNDDAESAQADTDSRAISKENRELITVPAPGGNSSLQPGGYPTELPSGAVAPLLHLGRSSSFVLWTEFLSDYGGLTTSSLCTYQRGFHW